jgi:hypothetical protein
MYTCGIIVESVEDKDSLRELEGYLEKERVADMPGEPEKVWHIRQYGMPKDRVETIAAMLVKAIKRGWYIHLFNKAEGVLYVVLAGRYFRLPAIRDGHWDEMIAYGQTVGVDRVWTENIPLSV